MGEGPGGQKRKERRATMQKVVMRLLGVMKEKQNKGDEKCCQELPVWTGEEFEKEAYMTPINRQVISVCTPRVCSVHNSPIFEIGTKNEEVWVKVEEKEIILTKKKS